MAENSECKKCQQNLLNYVSYNLNTKVEKEKEMEITKEKGETKSDGKSISDSISATSGPKQQRPRQGAQGLGIQSVISSINKPNGFMRKQAPAKTKGNTPNTMQTPKTRTPPSLERTKPPSKKLNLEERAMETDTETQCADIPRDNEIGKDNLNVTRHDTKECASTAIRSNIELDENTTRRNLAKQDLNEGENTTRSNTESDEIITRRNFTVVEIPNDETTINKNSAKVENPYEVETDGDDGETLEDLCPEFAKMGRILAREIAKSLSKALITFIHSLSHLCHNLPLAIHNCLFIACELTSLGSSYSISVCFLSLSLNSSIPQSVCA